MKKVKFIILLILLCINTFIITAQNSLEINVLDENKNPVSYSNIVLYDKNNEIIAGNTSFDGIAFFKNIIKEIHTLCITHIGYKDTCLYVNNEDKKDIKISIELILDVAMLSEVSVTAQRPKIKVNKENNISIDIENTKLKDAESFENILKYLPGVMVTSDGIRVFGSSDYVFMINGKEVLLRQEIEALKPEDIKEIEIITSNAKLDATSKYAINIKIIKRKNFFGIQIYDRIDYNRALENNNNLYFTYNTNKVQQSLMFSNKFGGFKYTENVLNQLFINQNEIYKMKYYNKGYITSHDNNFYYAINYDIDTLQYIGVQLLGCINNPKSEQDIKSIASEVDFYHNKQLDKEKNNSFQISLNYFYKIPKAGEFSFVTDYYSQKGSGNLSINENQSNYTINSKNNYNIYALKGDYSHYISKINTKASFGFKIYRTENKNNSITNTLFADDIFNIENSLTEQSAAGYLQFKSSIKKISIVGGLRLENYYKKVDDILKNNENIRKKSDFFPTLSITYNISNQHILMFNYSKNINRQAYNDFSGSNSYINPYSYKIGNINLKPEIMNNLSFTYIFGGFMQTYFRYLNSKNHTSVSYIPNDSIIVLKSENFDKQSLSFGLLFQKEGKKYYSSTGLHFSKLYIKDPNERNTLKFPNISCYISTTNTFNITNNIESEIFASYAPKQQYYESFQLVYPAFHTTLGVRHFFFDKSLRVGVYYEHRTIHRVNRESNSYSTDYSFLYKQNMFTFSLLYKFKFDQKWLEEKNSIETEKQRL